MTFANPLATVDPRRCGDPSTSMFMFMAYEGLITLLENGETRPALAKEITISDDGLTYTFKLREACWSDGHPLTAHDFEYSWKKILDPKFPAPFVFMLYPIKNAELARAGRVDLSEVGIKAVDDHTLVVNLVQPTSHFLDLLGFYTYFPIPKHIDLADPDWIIKSPDKLVISGPFKPFNYQLDERISMKKNTLFWDADRVALDGIEGNIIRDDELALRMFRANELDIIIEPGATIPRDAFPSLKKENQIQFKPIGGTIFFTFNLSNPVFGNKNIRKAFSHAVNRESITTNTTLANDEAGLSLIPSCLSPRVTEYFNKWGNKELAKGYFKKGLEELDLHIDNFPRFELLHAKDQTATRVAQVIQQQLYDALGINVTLNCADNGIYFSRLQTRQYDVGLANLYVLYANPLNILERFASPLNLKNYSGWDNQEFKSLVDQLSISQNKEQQLNLARQAEKLIMEEMPIAPIYHVSVGLLAGDHIKGIKTTPIGTVVYRDMYIETP